MNAYHLLVNLERSLATPDVADALGVCDGTVQRWRARRAVPGQYADGLRRLLRNGSESAVDDGAASGVDLYYTKPDVAARCLDRFRQQAAALGIPLDECQWIEPSAGAGAFLRLLPRQSRIGIDIAPPPGADALGIRRADFLTWEPLPRPTDASTVAVIGNPPFGLRGHLALQFLNRAGVFADLVGFILPPLFASDGKGSPAKRVEPRLKLAHSEPLPPDSFQCPDGRPAAVSTVFQVWTAVGHDRVVAPRRPDCDLWVKIYSLSDGGSSDSTRNKAMLEQCDVYLPSTCFQGMRAYRFFHELPHRRGYGVKVLMGRDAAYIRQLVAELDWSRIALRGSNGSLNLRASLIHQAIANALNEASDI